MSDFVPDGHTANHRPAKSNTPSGREGKTGSIAKISGLVSLIILVAGASFQAGKQVADVSRDKANAELSADNKVLTQELKQMVASEQDDHQRVRDAEKELSDTRAEVQTEHQLAVSSLQRIAVLSEQVGKDATCAPILKQIEAIQAALSGNDGFISISPPTGDERKELLVRLADWQKQLERCHG